MRVFWIMGHDDKHLDHQLERIADAFTSFAHEFKHFRQDFGRLFTAVDFQLFQENGGFIMGTINGVQAGQTGTFTASLVPANAVALQSGPTFSTDDPKVTLSPNPSDPTNPFRVSAAVAADDTAASFNLTVTGVNDKGTTITHTFAIPIPAAPPPSAVDFDLSQDS